LYALIQIKTRLKPELSICKNEQLHYNFKDFFDITFSKIKSKKPLNNLFY